MQSYKKASYQNALRLIIILYPYCKIFASPFLLLKSTKRDGSKAGIIDPAQGRHATNEIVVILAIVGPAYFGQGRQAW